MLIGIMSDSHDNLPMVKKAVELFQARSVETILHAGDIVSPFVAAAVAASGVQTIAVFGNNDGEKKGLKKKLDIKKGPHKFKLGGKTFVMAHDVNDIGKKDCKGVDVVVYGHSHEILVDQGPPLTINPGETGGWLSGLSTVALLDTKTMEVEIKEL